MHTVYTLFFLPSQMLMLPLVISSGLAAVHLHLAVVTRTLVPHELTAATSIVQ
jgi:hypothetical protein